MDQACFLPVQLLGYQLGYTYLNTILYSLVLKNSDNFYIVHERKATFINIYYVLSFGLVLLYTVAHSPGAKKKKKKIKLEHLRVHIDFLDSIL